MNFPLSGGRAADIAMSVSRSLAPPITLDDDYAEAFIAAVVAALDKISEIKDDAQERMSNPSVASDLIKENSSRLLEAALLVGTHTGKVPNPTNAFGALVADADVLSGCVGSALAGSATVASRRPLAGSGSAAAFRAMRLYATTFVVDGKVTALAEILAQHNHPIRSALLSVLDAKARSILEEVSERIREHFDRGCPPALDPTFKQLFFPVGEGYHIVTPVVSNGLIAEFVARLRNRRAAGERFFTRDLHVGGSKPQNAGVLALDIGGRFPHLVAEPPVLRRGMTVESLLYRLKRGRPVLFASAIQADDVRPLADLLSPDVPNNIAVRDGIQTSLSILVDKIVQPLELLAAYAAMRTKAERKTEIECHASQILMARCVGLIDASLSETEVAVVATDVAKLVMQRLPLVEVPKRGSKLQADDALAADIFACAKSAVEDLAR